MKKSQNMYRRLIEIDPENALAWYDLGILLKNTSQETASKEALQKALEAHLRKIDLQRHGGREQIRYMGFALPPEYVPSICHILGDAARKAGSFDRAIFYYKIGLEKTVGFAALAHLRAEFYHLLGRTLYQKGSVDQALKAVLQANAEGGLNSQALTLTVRLLSLEKRYLEPIPFAKKMLEQDPENLNLLMNLAYLYYRAGRHKQAVQTATEAIERDAENSEVHLILGLASEKLGFLQQAVNAYKNVFRLDSENQTAKQRLAALLKKSTE